MAIKMNTPRAEAKRSSADTLSSPNVRRTRRMATSLHVEAVDQVVEAVLAGRIEGLLLEGLNEVLDQDQDRRQVSGTSAGTCEGAVGVLTTVYR